MNRGPAAAAKVSMRLFRRFEDRLELLNASSDTVRAIDDLWLALHLRFEAIDAYRFVYRDMAYLSGEYPELGQRARRHIAPKALSKASKSRAGGASFAARSIQASTRAR